MGVSSKEVFNFFAGLLM